MHTDGNLHSTSGSQYEVYCYHSDSQVPANFDVEPLVSDNRMKTHDANDASTNVLKDFAKSSASNDESCDGANDCFDCANHSAPAVVAVNMHHSILEHEPVLHMGFQTEFSTAPCNNDKARNLRTLLKPHDRYLERRKNKGENPYEFL